MSRQRSPIFVIALLLVVAPAMARAADWISHNELVEGFSFQMPGEPRKALDGKLTSYIFAQAANSPNAIIYGLAFRKIDDILVDAERLANKNLDDFAASFSITPGDARIVSRVPRHYTVSTVERNLLKATVNTTQVMTGAEGRVQRQDGSHGIIVAFVDRTRHREFSMSYVVGRDARLSEDDARRFFNSFTLLF